MTNNINIIDDILSLKMWNLFLNNEELNVQDLVSCFDLYNICFLYNLKGFELPSYKASTTLDNSNCILNLFSFQMDTINNTSTISLSGAFKHETFELKNDDGSPYNYESIDVHIDSKRRGQVKNFYFNNNRYSSIYALNQNIMVPNLKIMATVFFNELNHLNLSTHYDNPLFNRQNLTYDYNFRAKSRAVSKMGSLEKGLFLLDVLEYNKHIMFSTIEKYIMLQNTPLHSTHKTKALKF